MKTITNIETGQVIVMKQHVTNTPLTNKQALGLLKWIEEKTEGDECQEWVLDLILEYISQLR